MKASCDLMAALQRAALPAIGTQQLLSRESKEQENPSQVQGGKGKS